MDATLAEEAPPAREAIAPSEVRGLIDNATADRLYGWVWDAFIFPTDGAETQALLRITNEHARNGFGPDAFNIITKQRELARIWNHWNGGTFKIVRPQATISIPGPGDLGTAISYMHEHPIRAIKAGIDEVKRILR